MFIQIAHAQNVAARDAAFSLVEKINDVILFPLIALMMAIAFLTFLWGAFEYVKNSDSEQGREQGKSHLLWGTVGMLVMLSAWAILNIAANTFGLSQSLQDGTTRDGNAQSPFASPVPTARPTDPAIQPSGEDVSIQPRGEDVSLKPDGEDVRTKSGDNLYQYVYFDMINSGASREEASQFSNDIVIDSRSYAELDTMLKNYVSSGKISNETRLQILTDKF